MLRVTPCAAALLVLGLSLAASAQDPPSPWARLDQESDVVRRARMIPKLGEAELDRISDLARAQKVDEAFQALEKYRDVVLAAHEALKKSGINAERKPNGFKHLEIHLRRSERQLTDIVTSLPFDRRAPFEAIQKELGAVDKELVDALFPRQPGRRPDAKGKKPGP